MQRVERLAAACVLAGFTGLEAPDWLLRRLARGLGGVVLFRRNIRDTGQLAALTSSLRSHEPNVLVAVDEEGGDVTRLESRRGSSYPGNLALGVVDDPSLTSRVAAAIAEDLAAAGVNLDLAPVADVNTNADNPVIGVRSFGSDPDLVARHTAAFVAGLQSLGVAACAKHFPGHGRTAEDSHLELPTVDADRGTLVATDLLPFRAAIAAGVRAIMTAHIRVSWAGHDPATLNRTLLHDLLRGELGFEGLVITDALEMRAVSAIIGMEEGATRALAAGADAVCLGADVDAEVFDRIHAAIVDAVRAGRLPEQRLEEAAGRVRETARWAAASSRRAGSGGQPGLEAARRALRAEGEVEVDDWALVVELHPQPTIAAGPAGHGLGDELRTRRPSTDVIRLGEGELAQVPKVAGRQLVVVVRDAHLHAWERTAVNRLLAGGAAAAVVVETGLPVWRPGAPAAYVATHGCGRVNLEAAAERMAPEAS